MTDYLARNLRFLCAEKPSIAMVCREIGINQQQFSKYLSGRARPSAHNLRRVAHYFGVDEDALRAEPDHLAATYRATNAGAGWAPRTPLAQAFTGDIAKLRPYLGAYQVYFRAPIVPNGYVVNAVFLDEHQGMVRSRVIELLHDRAIRHRRWTRCDGVATFQAGRIFVVDCERQPEGALSMYILSPPPRGRGPYLFGAMNFLASMPRRTPFASNVVWKRFDAYRSVKELFGTCGLYPADRLQPDQVVREYLAAAP